ncbi:hypothetical protein BH11MYX2_BH11MYX2_11040 [soil metagenome]
MKPTKPTSRNQGEGDRVAARHYNEQASEFVAQGRVDEAAKEAEAFVEADPQAAKSAEQKAKRGPHATKVSVDDLVNMGRSVVDRVKPYVDRAVSRIKSKLDR